jgi:F-type H+-transporting ATPase subunit delta
MSTSIRSAPATGADTTDVTTDERVAGYARAIFEVARAEGVLDRVGDELFGFSKVVEQDPKLREALTDPAVPIENRRSLVRDLLDQRTHPLTPTLIDLVLEAGRGRDLDKIASELVNEVAERREHVLAEVRTAVPLDDANRERLELALSSATGHTVEAKIIVDPSIVGGVVARVGDLVFDGSIAGRLEDAKHAFGR